SIVPTTITGHCCSSTSIGIVSQLALADELMTNTVNTTGSKSHPRIRIFLVRIYLHPRSLPSVGPHPFRRQIPRNTLLAVEVAVRVASVEGPRCQSPRENLASRMGHTAVRPYRVGVIGGFIETVSLLWLLR